MTDRAALREEIKESERDLAIPRADLRGSGEHTLMNHVQDECPHPACQLLAAQNRMPGHVRRLLALLAPVVEETIAVIEEGVEGEGVYTLAICRTRQEAEQVFEVIKQERKGFVDNVEIEERHFDTAASYCAILAQERKA